MAKSKGRVFSKITWEMKDGIINIVEKKKDDDTNKVVVLWDGKMRLNLTLRTIAKKVIDNDVMIMISRRSTDKKGRALLEFGPAGSMYHTLKSQGIIEESKPTITI